MIEKLETRPIQTDGERYIYLIAMKINEIIDHINGPEPLKIVCNKPNCQEHGHDQAIHGWHKGDKNCINGVTYEFDGFCWVKSRTQTDIEYEANRNVTTK
jgi:hypothetical protein